MDAGGQLDHTAEAARDRRPLVTSSARRVGSVAWLGVLAAGVGLFALLRYDLVASRNPALAPALILVGAAVVPLSFTVFVLGRRISFEVSGGTLAGAAALGGVVGVLVASTLEYHTVRTLGALPAVAVALIEETAKLVVPLALLVLMARRRQLAPVDGLLVGVACGAGFSALETMGYAFVALADSNGSVSAVDGVLLLRGLFSPAAHMAWTGVVSAAFWSAASAGWTRRSLARLGAAYVVAVGLHTAWDGSGSVTGYAVLAVLGLAALTYAALRLRAQIAIRFRPDDASQ